METKEQKIKRKFRKVVNTSPEFANTDKKKALELLCNWFSKNKRDITEKEFNQIIERAERHKKVNEDFGKLLVKSKELGFH
tara:strand:+ start:223 stop:465 length:243 start_codon:yes stop_codon:yes gene_type:complete